MKEEVKRILKLLEEGKINAEQAESLMAAANETEACCGPDGECCDDPVAEKKNKKILIKVQRRDSNSNNDDVNVCLPFGLLNIACKVVPQKVKEELKEQNIDLDEIFTTLNQEVDGDIVNIQTEDACCQVRVE